MATELTNPVEIAGECDHSVDCTLLSLLPRTLRTTRHALCSEISRNDEESTQVAIKSTIGINVQKAVEDGDLVAGDCQQDRRPALNWKQATIYQKAVPRKNVKSMSGDVFHCKEHNAEQSIEYLNAVDAEHLENTEIAGSIKDKESKINRLVDKLLSSCGDLDEDNGAAVVHQSLQINPVDVGRVNIADLYMVQEKDTRVFSNDATHSISDKLQLLQTSPIRPKSPLSGISALHRIVSLKNKLDDPFKLPSSSDDDDHACFRDYNPRKKTKKQTFPPDSPIGGLKKTILVSVEASRSTVKMSESSSSLNKLHLPVFEVGKFPNGCSRTKKVDTENYFGSHENATENNYKHDELKPIFNKIEQEGKAKRQKTQTRGKQKYASRQSLADADKRYSSGVRRSTRIKSRPLEYWRGERFLYGRIHDSLATVIGVKKVSPGKDGTVFEMKVESFVPKEYRYLVSHAAHH